MGPMSKLMSLFPGIGAAKVDQKTLDATQQRLRRFRSIMDSMTGEELDNPHVIKADRVHRIARGSGQKPQEVRGLLKHYESTKKAAHGLVSNRRLRRQLEKQFGNAEAPAD
jgi:signal recognition particle subunit SRP54